jgi:hypothetical protein
MWAVTASGSVAQRRTRLPSGNHRGGRAFYAAKGAGDAGEASSLLSRAARTHLIQTPGRSLSRW